MLSSFIRRYSKDMLPGGLADNKPDSEFDPEQLATGVKVEGKEHVNPEKAKGLTKQKADALAKEIAKDHLEENEHYYTDLLRMEKEHKYESKKESSLRTIASHIRKSTVG